MLVARFERLVYSVPRRAGLGQEEAADVFQEVFATLVRHVDRLEEPDRIAAWLVTTARRETWKVGRRVSRDRTQESLDAEDGVIVVADRTAPTDEVMVAIEEQALLRRTVGSLDERCRDLLLLLFYEDAAPSYGEIASRLGTREGSIGPTRARCLQKLRRLLEAAGF